MHKGNGGAAHSWKSLKLIADGNETDDVVKQKDKVK